MYYLEIKLNLAKLASLRYIRQFHPTNIYISQIHPIHHCISQMHLHGHILKYFLEMHYMNKHQIFIPRIYIPRMHLIIASYNMHLKHASQEYTPKHIPELHPIVASHKCILKIYPQKWNGSLSPNCLEIRLLTYYVNVIAVIFTLFIHLLKLYLHRTISTNFEHTIQIKSNYQQSC